MKFKKYIGGKYQETIEFRFRDIEVIADAAYIKTKSGVLQCIDCDDQDEHKVEVISNIMGTTNKAEEILRTYIDFEDVNSSEPVTLLPLTIIDAMEEYATQCQEDMVKDIKIIDLFISEINKEFPNENWEYLEFIKDRLIKSLNKQD